MKRFKFKSLTMRIWTTFTAIILLIICSISFFYFAAVKRIEEKGRIEDLKVAHDTVLTGNNQNQPSRFDEMKSLKGSDHFVVRINSDNHNEIININRRQGPPPLPGVDEYEIKNWMASFIKDGNLHEKQFTEYYKNMKFIFLISSIDSGKTYLISYVPHMKDNDLLYTIIIIGTGFIIIGFFTAKVVAAYISKPLKELEDYTIRIAHKDWKEPMKVKSEDEIGRLVEAMNRMQQELKHADEEEKMFLQSISHDLKTPVMVIMSHAEAIIEGVYIDSVEKTAEIIRDESISLEKKIKQMLYLNTLDYVLANNDENVEINLRELMLHMINRFEVVNSNIQWDLNMEDLLIRGNMDKIKISIENILDNALRYAESTIAVTLKKDGDYAKLDIYNDGPKIDDKHIGRIFDNFYKDKTGNFGLGLAISKKIVSFYKGEIKAHNRANGVSFIIKYPTI